MRRAEIVRETKETKVRLSVDLDGTGLCTLSTGIGFLDHMLDLLARHARFDLSGAVEGDLHVDFHHTTEDVGIVLGQAVRRALGDMRGITRYADVHLPMDETLTRVALDISGRPSWCSAPPSPRRRSVTSTPSWCASSSRRSRPARR
jgi:imidazoleglycerol-phosphate dehydratase